VIAPIETRENSQAASFKEIPPLNNGDHLSWAEFRRRYEGMPKLKKAELVEGIVYMPSPVHHQHHGKPHAMVMAWLLHYAAATPGLDFSDNATVELDFDNEVQPDALLRLNESLGGRCRITPDDYLAGPPELIVEVTASSAAYDLHSKLQVYRRSGVQEYLILVAYEQQTIWYALHKGEYHTLTPDAEGVLHSRVFPGLQFHPDRFWAGDLAGLLAALQQGLESPEHTAFLERLQQTNI
jgi:Uma2 family endonuclease